MPIHTLGMNHACPKHDSYFKSMNRNHTFKVWFVILNKFWFILKYESNTFLACNHTFDKYDSYLSMKTRFSRDSLATFLME